MADFSLYRLQADWDLDLSWDHAQSNLLNPVRIEYRYGLSAPFRQVADSGEMIITFDNTDSRYFIENSSSPLYTVAKRHALVRLQKFYSSAWRTIFVGSLDAIEADRTQNPPFRAYFRVRDPLGALEDSEYHPPLLINQRTDQILATLFNSGIIAYPYPGQYWMLGISGHSELGVTTILFGPPLQTFDTAAESLSWCGDNADEGFGVSAMSFIRDVVAAEANGQFFFDPKSNTGNVGAFTFWNRTHIANTTPFTTISNDVLENPPPLYRYGADVVNHFELNFEPRALGALNSVIYQSPSIYSVAAGATREFRAHYNDANTPTARVGAINPVQPAPTVDYIANSASDGSGTNLTSSVQVIANFDASSALVTLNNGAGVTAYFTTLQLRGQPLTSFTPETTLKRDGTSIANFGLHKQTLNVNFLDDLTKINSYGDRLLTRFKDPMGRVERVTLRDSTLIETTPLLGAGITCNLPSVSNSKSNYAVIGVEHLLDQQTGDDLLTLILEPV